jgi:inner membrane protein
LDSLTHIALGAAIGTAVLGRKVGPRAALWGAVCGTLPDLDVFIPHGDPVRDFTFHRAETHSLFWLTLAAPMIAWLIQRLHRRLDATYREWLLLVWLSLLAHPLLDAFTVYGTQLLLPFSDHPVGLGSIFIIDPLYTAPLIVGFVAWLRLRRNTPARAVRWVHAGIALSSLYLVWSVAAQAHIASVVQRSIATTSLATGRMLVTPSPLNTLLWRVVVMDKDAYHEGFRSLFDDDPDVRLSRHASNPQLLATVRDDWTVRRLEWFTKGFYSVRLASPDVRVARSATSTARQLLGAVDTAEAAAVTHSAPDAQPVVMTDLRMGQTPWFVFAFVVAEQGPSGVIAVPALQVPTARPPVSALPRIWRRIWYENSYIANPDPAGIVGNADESG